MVYILNGQASSAGGCTSCNWHIDDNQTCADTFSIYANVLFGSNLSVNFSGRGKVGGLCGGSDAYITFSGQGTGFTEARIDIWGAYAAGVWTSSTTVLVYAASGTPSASDNYTGRPSHYPSGVAKVLASELTGGCPVVLKATFTITDAGVISVL